MTVMWRVLFAAALAAALTDCSAARLRQERLEREESLNVYPATPRSDIVAALHAYLSNPANIRDAYVTEPAITPAGGQARRYTACVRFNAPGGADGYTGSKELLAVFTNGRFDQFIEPPAAAEQVDESSAPAMVKKLCGGADYKRFKELEAMRR